MPKHTAPLVALEIKYNLVITDLAGHRNIYIFTFHDIYYLASTHRSLFQIIRYSTSQKLNITGIYYVKCEYGLTHAPWVSSV